MRSTLIIRCAHALRFSLTAFAIVAATQMSVADEQPTEQQNQATQPNGLVLTPSAASSASSRSSSSSKFPDFKKTIEGATKHEGLFTLYEKDQTLYAEIRPNQYNQPLLAPIAIARGMASAGTPLNFGDEWILYFRRVGDTIQLVRKNIHYEATNSSLTKAVEQNFTDSVLKSIRIVSESPSKGALINLGDIFFTDFAQLGIGSLDRSRTSWHKIKTFKDNIELQVEATFSSLGRSFGGDDGVIDRRGVTVVIYYSLAKRPSSGYKPRYADNRVGHFLSATKDFSSKSPDTNFVRRINRWRLEKANPAAKLSPPKQQLIWWVEDTVPMEYRPYVEEGILEWNKAFEKIGFRNAIGVRWQSDRDEFDAEDINYCAFRWITTPSTFAMSGLRADPITGEMIDGDVIFDASWIRVWKDEYALMVGSPSPGGQTANQQDDQFANHRVLDYAEVISPMMALKQGYGLPFAVPGQDSMHNATCSCGQSHGDVRMIPSTHGPLHMALSKRMTNGKFNACQYAVAKRYEYRLAALAIAAAAVADDEKSDEKSDDESDNESDNESDDKKEDKKDDEESKENDKKKEGDDKEDDKKDGKDDKDDAKAKEKKKSEVKLPEELIAQAIKEVVMHEVGHSLGLRHNFKASTMLSLDEINDPELTRKKGLAGSVMDYNPLNISRKGKKQGDYATTTIGPYDYWAIEYAYKPISGNETAELAKIASRSPEPDLTYATDEDLYGSNDPFVNTYDLGDDPLAYAKDRMELAAELLKDIDDKVVRDGESWARLRSAVTVLLSQYANGAYTAGSYIGGEQKSRDHKGSKDAHDPIRPIAGEKQREALRFLVDEIFSDEAYSFSPKMLRRMTTESWYHWGANSFSISNFDVYSRVLRIQQIALRQCLSGSVLNRVQNHALLMEEGDKPLEVAEVFRTLTDSIWLELDKPSKGEADKLSCSIIRRNLQRDYLERLSSMVVQGGGSSLSSSFGYALFASSSSQSSDAKSLARMHLGEIKTKIDKSLAQDSDKLKIDDATKAHLEESSHMISKVLDANMSL